MKHRILIVNGNLNVGGVEYALVNLLRAFDSNKYEIDLLLLQRGYDYLADIPSHVKVICKESDDAGGPLFYCIKKNIRNNNWFCLNYRVRQIARRFIGCRMAYKFADALLGVKKKYDTAIAFRPGICSDIVGYAINATRKIAWWHHGDMRIGITKKRLLSTWLRFDEVVAVSDGTAEMLKKHFPNLTIKVIPNIIDAKHICYKSQQSNPDCEYDVECLKIVTIGRLVEEKHIEDAVTAAALLKTSGVSFRWHIIGDGILYDEIKSQIDNARLNDTVILLGAQVNPYPWIKNADMMVHTSHVESFGLVILEAMALGTPCVAARSIGAESIIDGKNGILAEPDVDSLVDAIMTLHNDRQKQSAIVQNAFKTVEQYSADKIIKLIEKEL